MYTYELSAHTRMEMKRLWEDIRREHQLHLLPESLAEVYYEIYRELLAEIAFMQYFIRSGKYESRLTMLDYSNACHYLHGKNPTDIDEMSFAAEQGSWLARDLIAGCSDVEDFEEFDLAISNTALTVFPSPSAYKDIEYALYKDLQYIRIPPRLRTELVELSELEYVDEGDDIYFSIRPMLNRLCVDYKPMNFINE